MSDHVQHGVREPVVWGQSCVWIPADAVTSDASEPAAGERHEPVEQHCAPADSESELAVVLSTAMQLRRHFLSEADSV